MSVPHPKGENIVWTCVKNHIIKEKEDYKAIGICVFDYKLFELEEVGGVSRCIIRVSLFGASNSVVAG